MLKKCVFNTLVYYDCFDYPLSLFEIWKHLLLDDEEGADFRHDLFSVATVVDGLVREGKVVCQRGMYVLAGRETLVPQRLREEKISVQKLRRARRLIAWLRFVPFVRMIGITGSLAMKKSEPQSDWDFFVVLSAGHMWLGRTWLTSFLHLLGKRRHGRWIENRACLNYYLSDRHLEISSKDLFSAHEYRFLIPVFDSGVFRRFEIANRWIATRKPNFNLTELPLLWTLPKSLGLERGQRFFERLSDWPALERWLAHWQRHKIMKNPKTWLPGSFVEASDRALIFLPHPKGPKVFERFKTRLSEAHS